jgi:RNA polymerase sigma factor (sigma-70 family)
MFRIGRQDDERIVRAVLGGRRDDYGILIRRHMTVVHAIAFAHTGNHADAEDVAQEAFLGALQTLDTLREPAKFPAWLVGIARHIACDVSRRRARETRVAAEAVPAESAVLPDMERREMRAFVHEQIRQLDEEPREVLVLHYFAGKPTGDIASLLGITEAAARKRLQRAREVLGERILAELGEVAELEPLLRKRAAHVASLAVVASVPWKAVAATSASSSAASAMQHLLSTAFGKTLVCAVVIIAGVGIWQTASHVSPTPVQTAQTEAKPGVSAAPKVVTNPSAAPVAIDPRTSSPGPTAPRSAIGVSVLGKVESLKPVSPITVTAYTTQPEFRQSGLADAENAFCFSSFIPGSSVYLCADAGSLKSKLYGPIPLSAEGLSDYTLTLVETGGVEGTVVDLEGHPVPEVMIEAGAPAEMRPVAPVRCDKAARFELTGLLPGPYYLRATPPGDTSQGSPEPVDVPAGEVKRDVVVVLDLGGDLGISGRVTDADGKPLEGVFIRICERPHWGAETDRNGDYRLTGLSNTKYAVEAYTNGYAHHTQWEIPAGSENVDFALPRVQTTLAGRVVRADTGAAISEFEIEAVPPYPGGNLQQLAMPLLFKKYYDPEGRFLLEDYHGGPRTGAMLLARAPGFAMSSETVALDAEIRTPEIILRLQPEAIVEGVVVDASDRPVPGALILIGPLDDLYNLDQLAAAYANDKGAFRLPGLSTDTTVISAYRSDYAPGSANVALQPGKVASVRIVLTAGGIVAGMVTADGWALPDAAVTLSAPGELAQSMRNTRSDSSGRFQFTGVPAGSMALSAFYPYPRGEEGGRTRRAIRAIIVQNGRTTRVDVDFQTHAAVLEGVAVCDGAPADDGSVTVWSGLDESREFRSGHIESGSFRVESLAPGPAQIEVTAFFPGRTDLARQKRLAVDLSENEPARVTVDFGQGARLTGQLVGLSGTLDAFVDVFEGVVELPTTELPYDRLIWPGTPDANGVFSACGFDAGTYTVVATLSNPRAITQADRAADFQMQSVLVELAENGEKVVQIPMR